MTVQGIVRAAQRLLMVCVAIFATHAAHAKMSVGTNLGGVSYYTTEAPFADMMRMASPWITSTVANNEWDSGQEASVPQDSNGWPKNVPFNDAQGRASYVHTILPCYADGDYTLSASGQGQVRVAAPGLGWTTFNLNWSGATFHVSGADPKAPSYIYLEIRQSTYNNALSGLHVWRPGYGDGSRTFYQTFKDTLAPYSTLRFMDWGATNGSNVVDYWNDATKATTYTQAMPSGVSVEMMTQLCNETGKDMWFCVPAKASDNYCWTVAQKIRDGLAGNRRLYVEYSNEVWNGAFPQSGWVNSNISDPTGAGYLPRRYGYRASQVFSIFRQTFGSTGHPLTCVLAGQAANVWMLQQALIGANNQCDALAIAPYFAGGVTQATLNQYGIPSTYTALTNDAFVQMQAVQGYLTSHRQLSQSSGKPLLCYEGGQHYVGSYDGGNTVDNPSLTNALLALNRSWDMANEYRYGYNGTPGYLNTVNAGGVSLFMHFNDCGSYSKYGYWGAREYIDQATNAAPKAWAITDWIANG